MVAQASSELVEYSAEFRHIELALKRLWRQYVEVVKEHDRYVSPEPHELETVRYQEGLRLKDLYRELSEQELQERLADFIAENYTPERLHWQWLWNEFSPLLVNIALISHALCECVINIILANELSSRNQQELFHIFEKVDVKEKWKTSLKLFSGSYDIRETQAWATLNCLTKFRNAMVHYKVSITVNGIKKIEGSKFEHITYEQKHRMAVKFFNLPYDLSELAAAKLKTGRSAVLFSREPINATG